mmetsp:Transcript_33627/g.64396  ORF Transcript_33627/g.64396 Transcript_33627/m.64396 type:complete len:302 (-) Transcript_33627:946-1851(-)
MSATPFLVVHSDTNPSVCSHSTTSCVFWLILEFPDFLSSLCMLASKFASSSPSARRALVVRGVDFFLAGDLALSLSPLDENSSVPRISKPTSSGDCPADIRSRGSRFSARQAGCALFREGAVSEPTHSSGSFSTPSVSRFSSATSKLSRLWSSRPCSLSNSVASLPRANKAWLSMCTFCSSCPRQTSKSSNWLSTSSFTARPNDLDAISKSGVNTMEPAGDLVMPGDMSDALTPPGETSMAPFPGASCKSAAMLLQDWLALSAKELCIAISVLLLESGRAGVRSVSHTCVQDEQDDFGLWR